MKFEGLPELLDTLAGRGLSRFSYRNGDLAVEIEFASGGSVVAPTAISAPTVATTPPRAEEASLIVTSPMVGTFYRAPAPGAPPFVEVGHAITIGRPVCIIEAMKLMNVIESEVQGTIVEILVENGQAVQYGQPLFRVRPG